MTFKATSGQFNKIKQIEVVAILILQQPLKFFNNLIDLF